MAAGVAAYSARLAWKQVAIQFSPKLMIRSEKFQIRTSNDLRSDFWWNKPSSQARYENGGSEDYQLSILNIGNAPAFDIRIYATIDYQTIYADIFEKIESIYT